MRRRDRIIYEAYILYIYKYCAPDKMSTCLFDVMDQLKADILQVTEQASAVRARIEILETIAFGFAGVPRLPFSPGNLDEIYTWGDILYRNDALDPGGYTLNESDEVTTLTDLSANQAHLNRHVLGRGTFNHYSINEYGDDLITPDEPMRISHMIGGHACFDGFMIQGKAGALTSDAGNVLLPQTTTFTIAHVYMLNDAPKAPSTVLQLGIVPADGGSGNHSIKVEQNASALSVRHEHSTGSTPMLYETSVPLLLVYRADRALSEHRVDVWGIDAGTHIASQSMSMSPENGAVFTAPGTDGSPLYIGCGEKIYYDGGLSGLSNHIHGETIIYNKYLDATDTETLKDYLINKWKTPVI